MILRSHNMRRWLRFCIHQNRIRSLSTTFPAFINGKFSFEKNLYHTSASWFTQSKLTIGPQIPEDITKVGYIAQPDFSSNNTNIPEVLTELKMKVEKSHLSNKEDILDNEVKICAEKLSEFSNEQIVELIHLLGKFKNTAKKTRAFFRKNKIVRSLLRKLNEECVQRFRRTKFNEVLPILEKFYVIDEHPSLLYQIFVRENTRIQNKPLNELIRFVSLINRTDHWSGRYTKSYEIEYYLERNFSNLSITDILTLLQALTLMKRPHIESYELKKKLLLYFIDQAFTIDKWHVYKFLNFLCQIPKFTTNLEPLTPQFSQFVDKVNEKFDDFQLNCISRICFMTTGFLLNKPEFLQNAYRLLLMKAPTAHNSCVHYMIRSLTFFGFHLENENPYTNILKVILNESFKSRYSSKKKYVQLLCWIGNVGIYDYNIINEILDENFIRRVYTKNLYPLSIYPYPFILDMSVEIECPNYTGNRLSEKLRKQIADKCYNWDLILVRHPRAPYISYYQFGDNPCVPYYEEADQLPYNKILQDAGSIINSILGADEFTHLCYILPHMPRANLLFGFDNNKTPQNISHLKNVSWVDWKSLDSSIKWNVVTVWIRNTSLNCKAEPLAEEITKIRQFKKLRFNVFNIVQDEWLNMNDEQKRIFCTNIIS